MAPIGRGRCCGRGAGFRGRRCEPAGHARPASGGAVSGGITLGEGFWHGGVGGGDRIYLPVVLRALELPSYRSLRSRVCGRSGRVPPDLNNHMR